MLTIDGRMGEGGGQVLRSSLSLAASLGVAVRVEHIRGGRRKPGLLRQHRTAARAVAEVTGGRVIGAELTSAVLELHPGKPRAGEYHFAVGSAGSALLVLQTVLPPLLLADGESLVRIEGGTHNPWAPPFEMIERSLAPLLLRCGARVELTLEREGFFPAGGGSVLARIHPVRSVNSLELPERGAARSRRGEALVAHLADSIAERELAVLLERLAWAPEELHIRRCERSPGPGNALQVTLAFSEVTEVLTAFGERGRSAESLAARLGADVQRYLSHGAPVGEHLADQLMLPMALLGGGHFRTGAPTEHARTNAAVLDRFLPGCVTLHELGSDAEGGVEVRVRGARG